MEWWSYVQRATDGQSQHEIARRLGVSASSVSRWRTSNPKPETVRAFAVAYQRQVREAFVAAGFLQPEDLQPAHDSSAQSTAETAERIWALNTLPQDVRRKLILELLDRPSTDHRARST